MFHTDTKFISGPVDLELAGQCVSQKIVMLLRYR